jgi:hypothetical protein
MLDADPAPVPSILTSALTRGSIAPGSVRVSVMPDACDGWRPDRRRVLTPSRRCSLISRSSCGVEP